MRNVNGECIATFCWNGQQVDPFDCWCPDPDTTIDSGTGSGGGFGGGASTGGGTSTITETPPCV